MVALFRMTPVWRAPTALTDQYSRGNVPTTEQSTTAEIVRFVAKTIAGEMSHGAQKQVELGIALAGEPRILLLDEPTAGISAQETHESIAVLDRIAKARGLTLLFTEHDMEVVFSISHKIAVVHQGRIIATDPPDEVRNNEEVRRVYPGGDKH